jgi:hypothetical protein
MGPASFRRPGLALVLALSLVIGSTIGPTRATPVLARAAIDGAGSWSGLAGPPVRQVIAADGTSSSGIVPALAAAAVTFPSAKTPIAIVRASKGGPPVRTQPRADAAALSGLYFDTYLPVYGQAVDPGGALWYAVRLWGVLPGWILASATETGDPPPPAPANPAPAATSGPAGPSQAYPLVTSGVVRDWFNLRDSATVNGGWLEVLAPGTPVQVWAWQTDENGSAWYQVTANGEAGWVSSDGIDLTTGHFSRTDPSSTLVAATIAGKGLWLPVPLLEMADPNAIVSAAKDLGLTHIYLEAGDSRSFYGQAQVDRLLPVAHRAGLAVIGWVLTSLNDLPRDVNLCATIANYQTPSGDHLDGIAPDVEFNMDPTDVTAFAQILRTKLGPNRLIVGVIYPAGSWVGQKYPVARPLSASFNALAPMDYWHDTQRAYAPDEITSLIAQSVADIHASVDDPKYPVEPIGQTYDWFSRNGAGPNSPTGAEVAVALQAAKDAGAAGVSLFQWGTTTPDEWDALAAFHWR